MSLRPVLASLALNLLLFSPLLAQTPSQEPGVPSQQAKEEQEKAQKELERKALALLDNVIAGVPALKLPENRAAILATSADVLWTYDEKRARSIFRDAVNALVEAFSDALAQTSGRYNSQGIIFQSRYQTISMVARRDPQLALELLRASHPPASEDAASDLQIQNQERQFEQSIALQAAANDPKQMLQIAEENLSKGFSYSLLDLLQRLQQKDPDNAAKFGSDIVAKLKGENLATNREAQFIALQLFQIAIRPQSIAVYSRSQATPASRFLDDNSVHDLADLIATAAMSTPANLMPQIQSLIPEIEKRIPERAAQLEKRLADARKILSETNPWMKYEELMQTGTAEAILEAVSAAPPEMRSNLYYSAAMKISQSGDADRARQIINDNVTGPARDQYLAQIDQQLISVEIRKGRVEEARRLLSRIASKETRVQELTNIAATVAMKGDKKLATELLDEALKLTTAPPENQQQLNALLRIGQIYATVDPARSFTIVEPLIDQANQLLDAAALLEGFGQVQGGFRKGEMVVGTGPSGMNAIYSQYGAELAALARADLDRAKMAADRFQRNEASIMARLVIAQAVLLNRAGFGGVGIGIGGGSGGVTIIRSVPF